MSKETQNKCTHLNCLVEHYNGICNCDMARYCVICNNPNGTPQYKKDIEDAYQRGKEEMEAKAILERGIGWDRGQKSGYNTGRLQTLEEVEREIPEVEHDGMFQGIKQYSNINHAINEYRNTVLQTINKKK